MNYFSFEHFYHYNFYLQVKEIGGPLLETLCYQDCFFGMVTLSKRCQLAVISTHWTKGVLITICRNLVSCPQNLFLFHFYFILKVLCDLPSSSIHCHLLLLPFHHFPTHNQVFSVIHSMDCIENSSLTRVKSSPKNSRNLSTSDFPRCQGGNPCFQKYQATSNRIHEKQSESKIRSFN